MTFSWLSLFVRSIAIPIRLCKEATTYCLMLILTRALFCSDTMASVESVKAASDIYAPVSGTIVEVNAALVEDPSLVNQSAEDKVSFYIFNPSPGTFVNLLLFSRLFQAWFVKIELDNQDELKELMSKDAYLEIC